MVSSNASGHVTDVNIHDQLESALIGFRHGDFTSSLSSLLSTLGYQSDRTLDDQSGCVDDFIEDFPARIPGTATENSLREHARNIRIVFQVTESEIREAGSQPSMFDTTSFDTGHLPSFMFAAVELNGDSYPRGRYAQLTREINKRLSIASVVLFRTSTGLVTLAFVHRRRHKRDEDRDVLGRVSLIREIDPVSPHRAHLDILSELSLGDRLKWIKIHNQTENFDGLLAAWLDALDTEELNRRFYRDLFNWFTRIVKEATFPTGELKTMTPEEHAIRLITRLLFVWFIKEKGLISEALFVEAQIGKLLRGYDRDDGDSYYRSVLQNLFFATLNTEIERRAFSTGSNATNRDFSLYRYRDEISDPEGLIALFSQTPFINGGLFDCLDSETSTGEGGYRIDCFSDNPRHRALLSVPNCLFFDSDGLITLFNRYKFTVEENTPTEQEVALDPELLGKVFENLLAAYNPETRETARKQTGSYYTPRQVVDYMIDEALVESLGENTEPTDGDGEFWCERLRYLLDYEDAFNDANDLFDAIETKELIRAIAEIRVLDPAVGSGAFPMGVLHKLTLALHRLDPKNYEWEKLQRENAVSRSADAYETQSQVERDAELQEISDTFEKYRDSDFGRKLYLIQNSIFGVDIQPVACQISKLRFFISLAIEQNPDANQDNFGIKPLPNLETRFIAANTLLGLSKPQQLSLGQTDAVSLIQRQLDDNRERHFHATTRRAKLENRRRDRKLREKLSQELRKADFSASDADRLSRWDPYDQNTSADWFDTDYMFGVDEGFDVVMGNPPYVQLQKNGGELGRLYKDAGYETFTRTGDVYQLFFERGVSLLRPGSGVLSYITSNSWLKAEYGKPTRRYFSDRHTPMRLLELGKDVFESAIVDSSVLLVREGGKSSAFPAVDVDRDPDQNFPPDETSWGQSRPDGEAPWSILTHTEQSVMDKMLAVGTPLRDWDIAIYRGITTGLNDAFIIDNRTKEALAAEDPRSAEVIKPVVRGRDIRRYRAKWAGMWLIDTHNGYDGVPPIQIETYPAIKAYLDNHYEQLAKRYDKGRTPYNLRNCAYHAEFIKEKLFWIDLTEQGRFAYDDGEMFCVNSAYMLTGNSLKYLCAVLNSALVTWFMHKSALNSGMGTTRWVRFTVDRIPVPIISSVGQRSFIKAVDEIQDASCKGLDTSILESEVDGLVYELYGLTEDEIRATTRK